MGRDEVFIALGDTICEYDVKEVLDSPYNMLGVKKVDDPRGFGVAEIDANSGDIEHVVEKPAIPKSNMALVGLYKIKESAVLFECLYYLLEEDIRSYGEYNLTDALDCMIRRGTKFKSFKVKSWFDCGKKETLLESNATLLKKSGGKIHENLLSENSIIIPPVSIGPGCVLKNAIVGPHVSIGADSMIKNSTVRDSIIGSFTHLSELVIDNSLIGSDVSIKGSSRSLSIGDNTEIDVG